MTDTTYDGGGRQGGGRDAVESMLKSLADNTVRLSLSLESSVQILFEFTRQVAEKLNNLYQTFRRTGVSVADIKALNYAGLQTDVNEDSLIASLEGLAKAIRQPEANNNLLLQHGIQVKDNQGKPRDVSAVLAELVPKLREMPDKQASNYAQSLGINTATLTAMRNGMNDYATDYRLMAEQIGFDADSAAQQSHVFITALQRFMALFAMLREKFGASLAQGMTGSLDMLREKALAIFPQIESALMPAIDGILSVFNAVAHVIIRGVGLVADLVQGWNSLDQTAKQLIETTGALIVAWRLLDLAFSASPIGLMTTLIAGLAAAILVLYDDFKTWQEGGASLIDWAVWKPAIDYALGAFGSLGESLVMTFEKVKALGSALIDAAKALITLLNIDTSSFSGKWIFDQIIQGAKSAIQVVGSLVDTMTKLVKGDFNGAWDALQEAAKHVVDSPVAKGASTAIEKGWQQIEQIFLPEDKVNNTGARTLPTKTPAWMRSMSALTDANDIGTLMLSVNRNDGYGQANQPVISQSVAASSQIQQQNTYNIYGSSVQDIGSEVERRQLNANAQALRNNQVRNS
ncbi:hypothetical protein R4P48_14065 [Atlantibacter subterranea]|uniref:Phage tail tape measure protein n=1 Tax=Atlantibacter subterraneus TaxID=255519 RepID=A0ABU4E3U9_9ENTR|nr:hypothetical protein [Atlantibacter subterranea]MDV7023798.1 hypothetical protein [Atlantibacter subterranea]MDZ5666894.1 hypothetical protein [Atlantibacter hermannii]